MKKLIMALSIVALTACATEYDKTKFHITSDTYYISEVFANDHIRESDNFKVVNITGVASSDTTVYYRVLWYDENGAPIKATTSKSTEARLRAEQPFNWTAIAPNASAKNYRVFISGRPIEQ
ncbi:MAG: DUF1425 domain-containing protein [Alphaproteobacteria bacterium]|nr:DUF1425 domain-containing protein [Alphaproteobacteria bacterium]